MGLLSLDYLDVAGKQGRTPPYESENVREALKHTISIDYNTTTEISPDTLVTLKNAGHVLGSSGAHFQFTDKEEDIVFSGDIHYDDTKLFNGAANNFQNVDGLILESTYGKNDGHKTNRDAGASKLVEITNRTLQNNGKVLIPAFAVGRSQEIMLVLEEAMRNGDLPEVPVHLDGMIWEASAIHTAYPEYLRDEVRNRIFHTDENPFLHNAFNQIDGGEDERRSIRDGGPCIVLTTSGMVTGGPVMSWLRHLAPDNRSSLVFVGYQADGTLGQQIQDGKDQLEIETFGNGRGQEYTEQVPVNMGVETVNGFSGHADREGLMDYVQEMPSTPNEILCVHGDPEAVDDLSSGLYHELGIHTDAPKNLETVRFD